MFGSQKNDSFAYGCAASPNWRDAAGQILSQIGKVSDSANLGFVYFTDSIATEARDILDYLRVNTGVYHWVGSVGMGVCATGSEYYDRPALAVMLCSFEPGSFQVFSGLRSPEDLERLPMHFEGIPANFAVVHADPRTAGLDRLVEDLAGALESAGRS